MFQTRCQLLEFQWLADRGDDGIDFLQRTARGEGVIRLGLVRPLGVDLIPSLARHFLTLHPDRDIHFSFQTDVTQNLVNDLNAHHYDLIFCSHPQKENGLTSQTVHREKLVLIAEPERAAAWFPELAGVFTPAEVPEMQ